MKSFESPYEGVVEQRRNRETSTLISLVDGNKTNAFDTEAGRWQTICEEHGTICSHEKRGLAASFISVPSEWCEDCFLQVDNNRPVPEREWDMASPNETD